MVGDGAAVGVGVAGTVVGGVVGLLSGVAVGRRAVWVGVIAGPGRHALVASATRITDAFASWERRVMNIPFQIEVDTPILPQAAQKRKRAQTPAGQLASLVV